MATKSDDIQTMDSGNDLKRSTTATELNSDNRPSKRLRKKALKFGKEESDVNDDDFFQTVHDQMESEQTNQRFCDGVSLNNDEQTETQSSENISVNGSEYSPGEQAIMGTIEQLSNQIRVLQRMVAEMKLQQQDPAVARRTITLKIEEEPLRELGLPLKTSDHLNDFEKKLADEIFRKKTVSY